MIQVSASFEETTVRTKPTSCLDRSTVLFERTTAYCRSKPVSLGRPPSMNRELESDCETHDWKEAFWETRRTPSLYSDSYIDSMRLIPATSHSALHTTLVNTLRPPLMTQTDPSSCHLQNSRRFIPGNMSSALIICFHNLKYIVLPTLGKWILSLAWYIKCVAL